MNFEILGGVVLVIFAIAIFALYVTNIFKLVAAIKSNDISLLMFSRVIGVFVPIWGVIMGLV